MKSRVKGESSERIAEGILKKLGYEILEKKKKVTLDEAEAFEVDFIAKDPSGVKYAVEVKAGKASVSDLRQIYADSKILHLTPLIVCKGLADEAAIAVSEKLSVKIVDFSEHYVLLDPEVLETIVSSAVRNVLSEYGFFPLPAWEMIRRGDIKIIKEIANSAGVDGAANSLKIEVDVLGSRLGEMRRKGILPQRPQDYTTLRRYCQQVINRYDLHDRLNNIEKKIEKIERNLTIKNS